MNELLETSLFELSKLFLTPVLLLIALLFVYAMVELGRFIVESLAKRLVLSEHHRAHPQLDLEDLELFINRRLEMLRIASRTAPMLGLIATMIPMGPALLSLSSGEMGMVGENLSVAFSAVIVALISASITFAILSVRRRRMLEQLRAIERTQKGL